MVTPQLELLGGAGVPVTPSEDYHRVMALELHPCTSCARLVNRKARYCEHYDKHLPETERPVRCFHYRGRFQLSPATRSTLRGNDMDQYDNTGKIALFDNDKKQGENDPDMRGSVGCPSCGKDHWISAWYRTPKGGGKRYLGGSVEAKDGERGAVAQNRRPKLEPCPRCDGTGMRGHAECDFCSGYGKVKV